MYHSTTCYNLFGKHRLVTKHRQPSRLANMTDLATLPVELVQQIATHAPPSALVALKLTSKQLFLQLPAPPRGYINTASECEKRAVRRYLAERRHGSDGRRKCILCDGFMPETSYRGRVEPVCKWHSGWFERILHVRALSSERNGDFTSRQRVSRTLCGHCKQVRGWDVERCSCEFSGGCDSCGSWEVECHLTMVDGGRIES